MSIQSLFLAFAIGAAAVVLAALTIYMGSVGNPM
jgi:hypothetical protein